MNIEVAEGDPNIVSVLELQNVYFLNNSADMGGAMYVYGVTKVIIGDSCGFEGNRASIAGSDLYISMEPYNSLFSVSENVLFDGMQSDERCLTNIELFFVATLQMNTTSVYCNNRTLTPMSKTIPITSYGVIVDYFVIRCL